MEAVGTLEFDAQLMIRVRDGDETSFGLLLERHRAPVIHFLYRMIPNQAVAEELATGVLVAATHVPLGMQVLARGIVFIDLAIAQVAALGVIAANVAGLELGATLAEAEEMAGYAREHGLRTIVGLQGRSDPAVRYARDLVARGEIGEGRESGRGSGRGHGRKQESHRRQRCARGRSRRRPAALRLSRALPAVDAAR